MQKFCDFCEPRNLPAKTSDNKVTMFTPGVFI